HTSCVLSSFLFSCAVPILFLFFFPTRRSSDLVPILQSGFINYDGHGPRPMPADGYYGDMNGDWSTSPSTFPSTVEKCWDWCSSLDRKSTRLNSSHVAISYAVFCLKKKKNN